MNKLFYVYILECSDYTLYTGYTNNLEKRIMNHNQGKASKYTRSRLPVKLIYFEKYYTKSEALKREISIKRKKRIEKLEIVEKGGLYEKNNSN